MQVSVGVHIMTGFRLKQIRKQFSIDLLAFLLIISTILSACSSSGDDTGGGTGAGVISKSELEAEIRNDLNNYNTSVAFTLFVKSANGSTFLHSTGNSSESTVYKSASSSKLVTAVIILSLVNDGVLSLEDNPQTFITSWPTTGNLAAIKLRHLLSFTSGLSEEPLCISLPGFDFASCIDNIISKNSSSTVPGASFYYGPSHMQVAGLMAINATGNTSWSEVFSQFQAKTGLFLSSAYNLPSSTNPRLAGGMSWTASDYLSFLEALYNKTILPDHLFNALSTDQISTAAIDNSPALAIGEDWHYGYGIWIECKANPYNCTQSSRVSSPGAFGAYPFMDLENQYYGILARQGLFGTFPEGIAIFESVSQKLADWAAME